MAEQTINQAQVDSFLATVPADVTPDMVAKVVANLRNALGWNRPKPVCNGERVNDATLEAVIAALEARFVASVPMAPAAPPAAPPVPAPVAGYVRVKVNPANFDRGVSSARRLHGTYDGATKTWLIPATFAEFIGPQNPGLLRVEMR